MTKADRILREVFANGGPMRASNAKHPWSCDCAMCEAEADAVLTRKHRPDPLLLKEQRRLIRLWKKGEAK